MRLSQLYKTQPDNIESQIQEFINKPTTFCSELKYLNDLLQQNDADKSLIIFSIEILFKVRKQQEILIEMILSNIERSISYKNSIFILRLVKIINNTYYLSPCHYYLLRLLKIISDINEFSSSDKKFDYDCIRLSSDDLKLEGLYNFVKEECIFLLSSILSKFSSNIGFPELGESILITLESFKLIPELKPVIDKIKERIIYIKDERKNYYPETNDKKMFNFEKEISKIEF